jgi:flagellar biosynthesis anti-sigma factor FlgM
MNDINGVNGYGPVEFMGQSSGSGTEKAKPRPPVASTKDQVEISPKARLMSLLASMPEIRADKVQEVKQALDNGTYDLEGKLPEALDKFLDDYQW